MQIPGSETPRSMQMAVFLVNICKFKNCGLNFASLGDLIQHIEESHIDTDPRFVEKQEIQQPPAIALSYVLRFYTEGIKREPVQDLQRKKQLQQRVQSPSVAIRSLTPTGSEFDEDEMLSEDEDSDDSWTTSDEFTTEFIMRYHKNNGLNNLKDNIDNEKPFACPVPGCKKRYKNVNGIKYHARHGHRKEMRVKKPFKCRCGKNYKTAQGLRNHALHQHPTTELLNIQTTTSSPISPTKFSSPSPVSLPSPLTPVTPTMPSPKLQLVPTQSSPHSTQSQTKSLFPTRIVQNQVTVGSLGAVQASLPAGLVHHTYIPIQLQSANGQVNNPQAQQAVK
ncbi:juxtaposed with another zinc finger protein 1 [Lingula anatina]|uniref:Juxtaposed with another zinc finger protein 1 n=1 Tax=Lingula anatina TaxID=7574 RepID=A0A1S3HQE8_LINAN|nr:juxtaposed with another zinc finger protein 1 [Lingula anatina]|eukprot:XP_013388260.1 juxtaposed with another zinc finger protein 1 [Lingula anatina]